MGGQIQIWGAPAAAACFSGLSPQPYKPAICFQALSVTTRTRAHSGVARNFRSWRASGRLRSASVGRQRFDLACSPSRIGMTGIWAQRTGGLVSHTTKGRPEARPSRFTVDRSATVVHRDSRWSPVRSLIVRLFFDSRGCFQRSSRDARHSQPQARTRAWLLSARRPRGIPLLLLR